MARDIEQLSASAQKVYQQNPDLAAKRQQQVDAGNKPTPAAASSPSDSGGGPNISLPSSVPDFVKEPLFIALVLLLGLMLYGRYVKPINLGLGGLATTSSPTVQNYIDQQNRKVGLIADTMPGRIIRTNPAKLGA